MVTYRLSAPRGLESFFSLEAGSLLAGLSFGGGKGAGFFGAGFSTAGLGASCFAGGVTEETPFSPAIRTPWAG